MDTRPVALTQSQLPRRLRELATCVEAAGEIMASDELAGRVSSEVAARLQELVGRLVEVRDAVTDLTAALETGR